VAEAARQVIRSAPANGLRVLVERATDVPLFTALLCVEAGSRYDPAGCHGLSSATAGTLLEGTRARSASELALAAESLGTELEVLASYETVTIAATGPAGCVGDVLRIMFEMAWAPRFGHLQTVLDRQRSEVAEELADPYQVCQRAFFQTIYGHHPRAHSPAGSPDGIAGVREAGVRAFHERHYSPERCTLAVVGDVVPEAVLELAGARPNGWRAGGRPAPRPISPRRPRAPRARFVKMDCRQVHLCVGHLGIARLDPRYEAAQILDAILGDSAGFGARLALRLRETEGLAYVVESDTTETAGLDPGLFRAYTATSAENVGAALFGIRDELRRIIDEPPSADEVAAAVAHLVGRRLVDCETMEGRAARLLRAERYGLALDGEGSYASRLASIGPADVHDAARSIIDPGAMSVVVVGPVLPTVSLRG